MPPAGRFVVGLDGESGLLGELAVVDLGGLQEGMVTEGGRERLALGVVIAGGRAGELFPGGEGEAAAGAQVQRVDLGFPS